MDFQNVPSILPSESNIIEQPKLTSGQDTEISMFDSSIVPENGNPERVEIKTIAHRGYSAIAPENTLPSYYLAAEAGFTTAECDVSWTKDGIPVLLHDEYINRTAVKSNGSPLIFPKKCSDMTYEELLNYDFGLKKGEEYKGTKIPTFEELLQCSKETGLNLYVELKTSSKFGAEQAKLLTDMVKKAGLEENITWISFNADYLKLIYDNMPDARLGYLSDNAVTNKTISTLEALKTDENEVFLDIKAGKMDFIADMLLDEAGFDFEAWTVDDTDEIERLKKYECNGITTNSIPEYSFIISDDES